MKRFNCAIHDSKFVGKAYGLKALKGLVLAVCFGISFVGAQAYAASANAQCADSVRTGIKNQIQRSGTMMTDFKTTYATMPQPVSTVANTPCMSKELTKLTKTFANAPSGYVSSAAGSLFGTLGPFSSMASGMFTSLTTSITNAANLNPLAKTFNSAISNAFNNTLGSLLTDITGDSAFSSALCGLMVDTLVKYVQCQYPPKLPDLGQLSGGLNSLLDKMGTGCAAQAAKSGIYALANSTATKQYAQSITVSVGSAVATGADSLFAATSSTSLPAAPN